tara:strand:- start:365 stop:940 length:576 start_codon:yes stop_codon:yes gene_type:complete
MIHEVIIITVSQDNLIHIAPMGIKMDNKYLYISPFKPSKTLNNLLNAKKATINFIDDTRVFAGIVTGEKKDWPLIENTSFGVPRLKNTNTHYDVAVIDINDDQVRPKIKCNILEKKIHKPFLGFNRAQFSVIEAAVLTSRLGMISIEKIIMEINYLKIGIDKTSGPNELEAWGWINKKINSFVSKEDKKNG